jgi:hypothetical protein
MLGNNIRKAFDRFRKKYSCTRTRGKCYNQKLQWWGSLLVQEEKYQEKAVKR